MHQKIDPSESNQLQHMFHEVLENKTDFVNS
uniref:Uncharacterized protein n=1 Tax=Rhizophora mucronata TaxID=61149 RepID=A0A2P2QL94_RHIMU